jgi:hypothetical protein
MVKKVAWSDTDLAYLAGMLDGEGTLGVYGRYQKSRKEYIVVCVVANTDTRVLDWLVATFGGNYSKRKRSSARWKTCYAWSLSDRHKLAELLPAVMPYMKLKVEQAKLVLALPLLKQGRQWFTPEEKERITAIREDLVKRTKEYNKRGTTHVD